MPRTIKQGDTRPDLVIDLALPDSDLTGITSWRLLIRRPDGTLADIAVTPAVDGTDPSTAVLTHALAAEDTAQLRRHMVEVEGTWADGGTTTFPTERQEYYDVSAALG